MITDAEKDAIVLEYEHFCADFQAAEQAKKQAEEEVRATKFAEAAHTGQPVLLESYMEPCTTWTDECDWDDVEVYVMPDLLFLRRRLCYCRLPSLAGIRRELWYIDDPAVEDTSLIVIAGGQIDYPEELGAAFRTEVEEMVKSGRHERCYERGTCSSRISSYPALWDWLLSGEWAKRIVPTLEKAQRQ